MKFELAKLPAKISPCPIAQAIVELRFDPKLPAEVITGVVFNKFKDKYSEIEKLPIMDLPQVVRDADPNLRYAAHLRLKNKDFQLQIGPRSFSIVCPKEYKGWTLFKNAIDEAVEGLNSIDIVKKPIRIGLRYISFFEKEDVFAGLNLDIKMAGNSLIGLQNIVRTEFDYKGFKCVVQLANNALLNNKIPGSSVDIDVIRASDSSILTDYQSNIEEAHLVEKEIFFNLMKDDFLQKFSPEYEK